MPNPMASDGHKVVFENGAYILSAADFGYSDPDGDAFAGIFIRYLPSAGTLTLNGVPVTLNQQISAAAIASGSLVFTPAPGVRQNSYAYFGFAVIDATGAFDQSPNLLTFDVAPQSNIAPTGTDTTVELHQGGTHVFTVADFGYADAEGDDISAVIITSLPTDGTLTLNGVAVTAGQSIDWGAISSEALYFTPDPGERGLTYATLTFAVVDEFGAVDASPNTLTFSVLLPGDYGPLGGEVRVNTVTNGYQYMSAIIPLAGGGHVVVWEDEVASGQQSTRTQTFDADGHPVGGEVTVAIGSNASSTALDDGGYLIAWGFQGNLFTQRYDASGNQVGGATPITAASNSGGAFLVALSGGGWAVGWQGPATAPLTGYSIYVQAFNPDGSTAGSVTQVNTVSAGAGFASEDMFTALDGGGFVVTFTQQGGRDGSTAGVYSRVFDAQGHAVGSDFQVNTFTQGWQAAAAVHAMSGGGFLVLWTSDNQDGSNSGIYGQRYSAAGAAVGGEFRVNTITQGYQTRPEVCSFADGSFLIAWNSESGISAQHYDSAGVAVGAEFQLVASTNYAGLEQVAALPDGGWIVVFTDWDGSSAGIYAEQFDANGQAVGGVIRVSTFVPGPQYGTDILLLPDGNIVIAWQSDGQDGSGQGVYQQVFTPIEPNLAPTGASTNAAALTGAGVHVFAAGDFNLVDPENDPVGGVQIAVLPTAGTLTLNGVPVTLNQIISAADLAAGLLVYTPPAGGISAITSIRVRVIDEFGAIGATTVGFTGFTGSDASETLKFTNDTVGVTVSAGGGADLVIGGSGNDRIEGGAGDDNLNGGLGADLADYANATGAVTVDLGNAAPQNTIGAGLDTLSGFEGVIGSAFADTITGSLAADDLRGGGGNDTLKGLDGNDTIDGGDGNDVVEGGLGNDSLIGGAGTNDRADYRLAASAVTVNLGLLTAQNTVGAGTDTLSGFEGVIGSAFNDTLTGDGGANTLDGRNGNDTLNGGAGGDILIGGLGADAMNGGGDLDYASYINATAGVGINLTTGVHTGEALGDTFVSIERYRLGAFNDSFTGSAATDYAYGADGDDTLNGAGGIDRLYGQIGNDTLNGDAGNDILLGGAGADIFNGGADRDTASYEESTIAITMNLATGVHTGDAAGDTFTSIEIFWLSAFNDTFTGGTGVDEVRGADGIDTLNGGDGADILRGENGADILNGDAGDDFLYGGANADQLNGGLGVDTASYLLATAGVTINLTTGTHTGEAAGDTFVSIEHFQLSNGFTLIDTFTGSAGADWVAGYKGVDNLNGMAGNDTLNGGEHNDVINGGADNDKLIGGTGNDTLTGGTGADQFWANGGLFGADTVTDFENGIDKVRLTGISGVTSFANLTISTNGSGWAVITLPDGSSITLTGVVAGLVDASDFLFV